MSKLFIQVKYPIDNPANFEIDSDIKKEKRVDILSEFIRTQLGQGADASDAEEHDVYTIRLVLDLRDDTFTCQHNCGNMGLVTGILMDVLKRMK